MAKIKSLRDLLYRVRFLWISLISNIKNLFLGKTHTSSSTFLNEQSASNKNGYDGDIKEANTGNEIEIKNDEIDSEDEQEVWYDALEKLEESALDEEEYFDAAQDLDEQEVSANSERREYEKNKYYSLQNGLQEKTELDNTSQTLALAFEINELIPGSCNTDLSNLKLFAINKVDHGYALFLKDDKKNCVVLRSECLDMYFPPYFEKHSGKKTYAELFSPKENMISNDIIIPLSVPKEVDIFSGKFVWNPIKRTIQSSIPDFPRGVYLKHCEDHVNFYLNSDNIISLSITSTQAKARALASGTPFKTEWSIKDVLVRGEFANTVNKYTYEQPVYKQPEVEEVNSDFEYIEEVALCEQTSQSIQK